MEVKAINHKITFLDGSVNFRAKKDNLCSFLPQLYWPSILSLKGFFGKGILSRSKPEHEKISNISQLAFSSSDKLRRCEDDFNCLLVIMNYSFSHVLIFCCFFIISTTPREENPSIKI